MIPKSFLASFAYGLFVELTGLFNISDYIGDVPGRITKGVIFLTETVNLASTGKRHVIALEKTGGLFTLNFWIPPGAAIDVEFLFEGRKFIIYFHTAQLINRF